MRATFTTHDAPTLIRAINPKDMLDAFHRVQRTWRVRINRKDRRRRFLHLAVAALAGVALFGAVAGEWILLAMK
jgi:hypothetical protein